MCVEMLTCLAVPIDYDEIFFLNVRLTTQTSSNL